VHNYVLERVCPSEPYRWVIFCSKCGHVAFYGNAPSGFNEKAQSELPRPCAAEKISDPLQVEERCNGKEEKDV